MTLPLWDLAEVLLERRRVKFGGNDDGHLRGEEALHTLVVKMEEVVEAENAAAAKIAVETVEAVDLPCMSSTSSGLTKRGLDGQEGSDGGLSLRSPSSSAILSWGGGVI